MPNVTDAEVDAALQELLHERNSLGDGCFGCGYGGFWTEHNINNNKPFYREMIKRVLEAVKQAHASSPTVLSPPPTVSRPRPVLEVDSSVEGIVE